MTLGPEQIAARLPHQGRMCLLEQVLSWSDADLNATASSHRRHDNPLRSASGLLAPCAVEYAAQAMALHGSLLATADAAPRPGMLASVRNVRLGVARLDTLDDDLLIHAERLAGDDRQVLYAFHILAGATRFVAEGRATVLLGPAT